MRETEADGVLEADSEISELLHGAVDLHVHPSPSPFPRRITILQAAQSAADAGFAAIAVKSHHASMQPDVLSLQDGGLAELDINVHSGIVLNRTVGGFNPYAVELTLSFGGTVVWFPTLSARAHIEFFERDTKHSKFPTAARPLRAHEPMSALDDSGALLPEIRDILDTIAEYDAVLNTGHLSADEIDVLIPAAKDAGVNRIVVSHPSFILDAPPERCLPWVRAGALIEHCIVMAVGSPDADLTQPILDEYLGVCGVENTIFSSDLGQAHNILPVTGYRRMVRRLLDSGYAPDSIRRMVGSNARTLLVGAPSVQPAAQEQAAVV